MSAFDATERAKQALLRRTFAVLPTPVIEDVAHAISDAYAHGLERAARVADGHAKLLPCGQRAGSSGNCAEVIAAHIRTLVSEAAVVLD
jgi:hypothetical protein